MSNKSNHIDLLNSNHPAGAQNFPDVVDKNNATRAGETGSRPANLSRAAKAQEAINAAMNGPDGTRNNVPYVVEQDNKTMSGVRAYRPIRSLGGEQVQRLFKTAMNSPAVAENTPGADGKRIFGTITKPGFNMSLCHGRDVVANPFPKNDLPSTSAPPPPPSDALESNVQVATAKSEKASLFHLCYFAEAIYAPTGMKWRYGHPDPITQIPVSANSRFRLTVEARTNICSPSYGTPWPEMGGCFPQDDFHQNGEMLYGQIQIAFVLRQAPEAECLRHETGNTSLLQQTQQQHQQQEALPQLTTLEPTFYVPQFFFTSTPNDSFTDGRVACGTPVDHQHPAKHLPYPAAVLGPQGGYLGPGNKNLVDRASRLLADGQQTSIHEPDLQNGLVPAVKGQLREALRWGMAAELLGGGRLPAQGEPLVLDETEFAVLEPEFEGAVAQLDETTLLTSLVLALKKLREKVLVYEKAKDAAAGDDA
ncbi:hypothetical protein PG996_004488 [Apiospora saccharicola]|uniref:Peptidase S74 domain-containing protein n=1 Tax=Apiospora saccharicola TaxID=335842 RepID=A0ABR1W823_9PEZI